MTENHTVSLGHGIQLIKQQLEQFQQQPEEGGRKREKQHFKMDLKNNNLFNTCFEYTIIVLKEKNIIWLKFSNDREKQKTNYSWKYIVDILNT